MNNKSSKPILKKFYRELLLTTVSNVEDYSQGSHMIDVSESNRQGDTKNGDSTTKAWHVKVFLN